MLDKLPYINILQSAMCVPPTEKLSISIDLKMLPDTGIKGNPFFGVWLLDVSGSMSGDRIRNARESLIEQVKMLPDGTKFNLILFESTVKTVIKKETIDSKSRKKIINHIKRIKALGGTALYNALEKGIKRVRKYRGDLPKKIILITDGEPGDVPVEVGNENDPNYDKYFLLAHEALEYKASIDTVGALGEHNVYLLYEIAKQSTGKYIYAEDALNLRKKMTIATEQTTRIVYDQPSITLVPKNGHDIEINDAVQYKPTIIRMPFEKIKKEHKAWMRSFEAGDTYQIILKMNLDLDMGHIDREGMNHLLDVEFDFGKKLKTTKEVNVKFSEVQANHRINPQINKKYANLFSQAEEITEQTIKNDASATQRIQGDETKKLTT